MISTVAQVKTRTLALLDDPTQGTFTDPVFAEGFDEAWDALYSAFLQCQIPFIENIVTYILPANTTSFSPLDAGIQGFGELVELEERTPNVGERFVHVWEKDKLSQRDPGANLLEFVWRLDRFETLGSTEDREIRITYWDTSASFPATGSVGVDGAITFLSKYAAAAIGPRKGYDELADKYKTEAVGSRYDDGILGGALYRLVQPMVRSRQRVPTAVKPYSVVRRRWQKRQPYIAANNTAATGGGTVDIEMKSLEFSSIDGTISGTINGSNTAFTLSQTVTAVRVHLNGVRLTQLFDYTFDGTTGITFTQASPPKAGDIITADGFVGVGKAPVEYSTATGTLTGAVDGSNTVFLLPTPVNSLRVYRNGVRLTMNLDYTGGANQITLAASQIPRAGDVITADGSI